MSCVEVGTLQRRAITSLLEKLLRKVADGPVDPVNVASPPDGSGRLFVVERPGRIVIVENRNVLKEPFLDIQGKVLSAFLEQGLYDMVFHPNFKENGRFYIHYAELLRNGATSTGVHPAPTSL